MFSVQWFLHNGNSLNLKSTPLMLNAHKITFDSNEKQHYCLVNNNWVVSRQHQDKSIEYPATNKSYNWKWVLSEDSMTFRRLWIYIFIFTVIFRFASFVCHQNSRVFANIFNILLLAATKLLWFNLYVHHRWIPIGIHLLHFARWNECRFHINMSPHIAPGCKCG